jgi:hypothetical protein
MNCLPNPAFGFLLPIGTMLIADGFGAQTDRVDAQNLQQSIAIVALTCQKGE